MSTLAAFHRDMGAYDLALPLFEESLAIRAKVLGKANPTYSTSLNNLAHLYKAMGAYSQALTLYEESLAATAKVLGKEHPDYASRLNSLALLHQKMGSHERALPLYEESLAILAKVLGREHADYAAVLTNLATVHHHMHAHARALLLYEEARAILAKVLGKKHADFASILNNLALLHQDMGAYEQALPLYEESLDITHKFLGKEHPDYATILHNLALLQKSIGADARALPMYKESLAIRAKVLGKEHPSYASSLNSLALLHTELGAYDRALPMYVEAAAINERRLENTSVVLSETQQMLMAQTVEYQVGNMISHLAASGNPASALLSPVLRWKGSTFTRQRLMRLARESRDADVQAKLSELQSIASRLATLTLSVPDEQAMRGPWRQQLDELNDQREQVERQLSTVSAEFRALKAQSQIGLSEIQNILPIDAALIDLREYNRKLETKNKYGAPNYEAGYCAIVIRAGKPPRLVALGSKARIDELIGLWRDGYGESTASETDFGGALRELLWRPLVPELEGTTTVLVSPEGLLAMLPWGALPGSQPGSFLIEEISIVNLPVPRMLPEMLDANQTESVSQLDLLLVGGIDFDEAKTSVAVDQVSGEEPIVESTTQAAALQTTSATVRSLIDRSIGDWFEIVYSFTRNCSGN
ncbi:MAG: tetratricopeptide repeat protein [Pirellulaceae bacterium]|nr:tetratricopeptide repeat protein [Pirellulaceae bacterium]